MMSEVRIFTTQVGGFLSGSFTNCLRPATMVSPLAPFPRSARVYTGEVADAEESSFTVPDEDIRRLDQILREARQQLEERMASKSELEIPEVFSLRPLSSKRVTVNVRKVEPARFYFVPGDDVTLEDVEG